jgi:hypothetical protein
VKAAHYLPYWLVDASFCGLRRFSQHFTESDFDFSLGDSAMFQSFQISEFLHFLTFSTSVRRFLALFLSFA